MALRVVGQRFERYDGLEHVTGQTRYVDDISLPGTLVVKALRSPVIRGRIRELDVSAAEKAPGVAGVITHLDVPQNRYGLIPDQPVLVEETAMYRGEPIAALAAENEAAALEALEKIRLVMDEEPGVLDVREAMKPEAPRLRPQGNQHFYGDKPFRLVEQGDVAAGLAQADLIVEGEYLHPAQQHAQLETQVCLAVPSASGRLTIHTVSQDLQFHLKLLCGILQMPASKIRYAGGTVGGSFGAKNDLHADHVTALLALKTGRPCKWRWTREEELLYSTCRGAWHVKIRDGVKKDGRIIARDIEAIRDSGAYALRDVGIVDKFCFLASGPYLIPNVRVKGHLVYTNKPPASSMRGYGITPSTYSVELQMNKIAARLNLDPWEIRLLNAYRRGDRTITGRTLNSVAVAEVLKALAEEAGVELPERLRRQISEPRGADR